MAPDIDRLEGIIARMEELGERGADAQQQLWEAVSVAVEVMRERTRLAHEAHDLLRKIQRDRGRLQA